MTHAQQKAICILGGGPSLFSDLEKVAQILQVSHHRLPPMVAINHHANKMGLLPDIIALADEHTLDMLPDGIVHDNLYRLLGPFDFCGIKFQTKRNELTAHMAIRWAQQRGHAPIYLCGFDCSQEYCWDNPQPQTLSQAQQLTLWDNNVDPKGIVAVSGPLQNIFQQEEITMEEKEPTDFDEMVAAAPPISYPPPLDFEFFAVANALRNKEWPGHPAAKWSLADRGNELAGEVGELCNVIKKLRRLETGVTGKASTKVMTDYISRAYTEIGDVFVCAALVFNALQDFEIAQGLMPQGVTLTDVVRDKFNDTSDKVGLHEHKI